MSRRGIHPLLRGLDRPQQVAPSGRAVLLSGLESSQRKRYLRSEAEESETTNKRSGIAHLIEMNGPASADFTIADVQKRTVITTQGRLELGEST